MSRPCRSGLLRGELMQATAFAIGVWHGVPIWVIWLACAIYGYTK